MPRGHMERDSRAQRMARPTGISQEASFPHPGLQLPGAQEVPVAWSDIECGWISAHGGFVAWSDRGAGGKRAGIIVREHEWLRVCTSTHIGSTVHLGPKLIDRNFQSVSFYFLHEGHDPLLWRSYLEDVEDLPTSDRDIQVGLDANVVQRTLGSHSAKGDIIQDSFSRFDILVPKLRNPTNESWTHQNDCHRTKDERDYIWCRAMPWR